MHGLSLIILKATYYYPHTKKTPLHIIENIYTILENLKAIQEIVLFHHFSALSSHCYTKTKIT